MLWLQRPETYLNLFKWKGYRKHAGIPKNPSIRDKAQLYRDGKAIRNQSRFLGRRPWKAMGSIPRCFSLRTALSSCSLLRPVPQCLPAGVWSKMAAQTTWPFRLVLHSQWICPFVSLREKDFLRKRIWLARCLSLGQSVKRIEGRINGAIPSSSLGTTFGNIFEMHVKDSQAPNTYPVW